MLKFKDLAFIALAGSAATLAVYISLLSLQAWTDEFEPDWSNIPFDYAILALEANCDLQNASTRMLLEKSVKNNEAMKNLRKRIRSKNRERRISGIRTLTMIITFDSGFIKKTASSSLFWSLNQSLCRTLPYGGISEDKFMRKEIISLLNRYIFNYDFLNIAINVGLLEYFEKYVTISQYDSNLVPLERISDLNDEYADEDIITMMKYICLSPMVHMLLRRPKLRGAFKTVSAQAFDANGAEISGGHWASVLINHEDSSMTAASSGWTSESLAEFHSI
ncbi:hypothetical protein V1511DRAFT_495365 [Dipodascopsis uninucleata]